jgi:hypothetical protein
MIVQEGGTSECKTGTADAADFVDAATDAKTLTTRMILPISGQR